MDENLNLSEEEFFLLNRFDKMMQTNDVCFFDIDELETIIDCYLNDGDLEKAITAIRFALHQYPDELCFKLKQVDYFMEIGQWFKATQILDNEPFEEEDPEILMRRAQIYSKKDQPKKAIKLFKKVIEIDEDYKEDVCSFIALEYLSISDFKNAIIWFKRLFSINPTDDANIPALSACYTLTKDFKNAIKYFKDYLTKNPYSAMAWYELGTFYVNVEEFEKAIDAFDFALAIEENFSLACCEKATTLSLIERYDEAIDSYKEQLAIEGPDSLTYYYIGECYEKKRDFDTAFSYYTQALKTNNIAQYEEIYCGIAICLKEKNHLQSASQFIDKAIKNEPEEAYYWCVKADIERRLNCIENAKICYQKALDLEYSDCDTWLEYSDFLMEIDEAEEGIEILIQGMKLLPTSAEIRFRLAACFAKYGKLQEAISVFSQALSMNKNGYQMAFEYYPAMNDIPQFLDLVMDAESEF